MTVLAALRSPTVAITVGETLLRSREVDLVPCSEHFLTSVEAFGRLAPLGLSFVDATIVTIARALGEIPVATFDRGFRAIDGLSIVD